MFAPISEFQRFSTNSLGFTRGFMAIVHKSKVDSWFIATLGFSVIVSLAAAGFVVYMKASPMTWGVAVFTAGIGAGLPVWLIRSTYYAIGSEYLLVRCGPFKFNIRLTEISHITPSNNLLSSPALSLDRLRIDYGQGRSLMISPCDKEQFLKDIRAAQNGAA